MNFLGKLIVGGSLVAALGFGGFVASEYADYPMPFTKSTEMGRTKNSISAVIGGNVARQMYTTTNSELNLEIQKKLWPNAHVTGYTSENSIATDVNDLTFTSVHYKADKTPPGKMKGTVDKSEFDWDVDEKDNGQYHVHRFAFKFNSDLELQAKDGKITGTYIRHGPKFDWKIDGNYDKDGNTKIHVNVPLGLDFNLEGKINQK